MRISQLFRFAVAALVMAAASPAFALVEQKDIIGAVNDKDYAKAERLVRQNLAEKPDSPRYHYELGQILGFQERHSAAAEELIQARKLDPSLRFAKSSADYSAKLENEVALAAAEKTPAQQAAPKPSAPQQSMAAPPPASVSSNESTSSFGWAWAMLGLAAVGGIAFVIHRRNVNKRSANARAQLAREQMARLVSMSGTLNDAHLTTRASTYADEIKTQISARIDALVRQVGSTLSVVRGGTPVSDQSLTKLSRDVDTVSAYAASGISPDAPRSAPVASSGAPSRASSAPLAPSPSRAYSPRPAASGAPVHHHHHYGSTRQPPVVVHNNSDGFVSGMVAGSLLSGDRHHECVVEREVPRYEPPPRNFDAGHDDERKERVAAFDAGNDDRPAPSSFDAGNNDD